MRRFNLIPFKSQLITERFSFHAYNEFSRMCDEKTRPARIFTAFYILLIFGYVCFTSLASKARFLVLIPHLQVFFSLSVSIILFSAGSNNRVSLIRAWCHCTHYFLHEMNVPVNICFVV